MGTVTSRSPFAPETLAELPPIEGVRFATAEAGIRYKGRTDLMVAVLDEGTQVAGVLTQSKTASAPVLACRKHLKKGEARVLVVNSGNANAFTGKKGREAVDMTVDAAMEAADGSGGDSRWNTGVFRRMVSTSAMSWGMPRLYDGRHRRQPRVASSWA